jgi:hypothetical protein
LPRPRATALPRRAEWAERTHARTPRIARIARQRDCRPVGLRPPCGRVPRGRAAACSRRESGLAASRVAFAPQP